MFVKDNPCDNCLVKSCCTQLCDEKTTYTDTLIRHLTYYVDKYTLQKRGQRYPTTKRIPRYQQKEWDRVKQLCQETSRETQDILMRTLPPMNFSVDRQRVVAKVRQLKSGWTIEF